MNIWQDAGLIIVSTVFDFAVLLFLLRLFLQLLHADFYNPLVQFVVKITSYVVNPLQRLFPTVGYFNFAALVAVLLIEMAKISLMILIGAFHLPHPIGVVVWAIGDSINHAADMFFFAILMQAILSWFRPRGSNPLLEVIYRLTYPVLRPCQRLIPPLSGFDISPILAMFLMKLTSILIAYPIMKYGLVWTSPSPV